MQSCCDILDMPNWAFSYALAKKRIEQSGTSLGRQDENSSSPQKSADVYLQDALFRFPSVLCLLIENNKDALRCANNMDWSYVATCFKNLSSSSDAELQNNRAIAHIIQIYIHRSRGLWYNHNIWNWLYECARCVMKNNGEGKCITTATSHYDEKGDNCAAPPSFSALERYLMCDPEDYEDAFKRLPIDANPLEGALVQPALVFNNDRRNNLRMPRQVNNDEAQVNGQERDLHQFFLGQLGAEPTIINPDEPILSVFFRSILPWARVDGVP